MTIRRLSLPYRLRHPYLRRTRTVGVQCVSCLQWVKPRYLRVPACVCRRCEAAGLNQTWKPSVAHLEAARVDAARAAHIRRLRSDTTLAGR